MGGSTAAGRTHFHELLGAPDITGELFVLGKSELLYQPGVGGGRKEQETFGFLM